MNSASRPHGTGVLEGEIPDFAKLPPGTSLIEFRAELVAAHRHEDTLLNSRLQGYLVAMSLLAAAYSQFREPRFVVHAAILCVAGFALSVVMMHVLRRTAIAIEWYITAIRRLEELLFAEQLRPYDTRRRLRRSPNWSPVSAILAVQVPRAAAGLWVLLAVLALIGSRFCSCG